MSGYNYLGRGNIMQVLYPNYGDVILDTTDNQMKVFDGIDWHPLAGTPTTQSKEQVILDAIKNFLQMKNIDIKEFEEYIASLDIINKLSEKE